MEASSNVNKVPAGENKKINKEKSHQQYSMASALINLFPELAPASHMVLISSGKVLHSLHFKCSRPCLFRNKPKSSPAYVVFNILLMLVKLKKKH